MFHSIGLSLASQRKAPPTREWGVGEGRGGTEGNRRKKAQARPKGGG